VTILTPRDEPLTVPVHGYEQEHDGIRVRVIKDGGDDPDVTHETPIECLISLETNVPATEVLIQGGRGVGRVTRPGLPIPVGEPAINPAPRAQIERTVRDLLDQKGITARVRVLVEVPQGEQLASKTLNPRLGIEGGISILGTRGTVKPFSNEAYLATIDQCLRSIRVMGENRVGFTTGGRSERLLQALLPAWPGECFVTVADFFEPSLAMAADQGVTHVVWGVFFGKLVKQALGLPSTHAKNAAIDFDVLASWWRDLGLSPTTGEKIAQANTALHVQEIIRHDPDHGRYYELLIRTARGHALQFGSSRVKVDYCLFDFNGDLLASTLKRKPS
jgi:cobalt-precorrin-5B (C1)-methyltransferase